MKRLFLLALMLQSCASPDRRELENHLTPEARAAGDTAALLDYLTAYGHN